MPTTITIRTMSRKELMAICQCSRYELNKTLAALAKKDKTFKIVPGERISKTNVKIILTHTDILPENFTIQE